MNKITEEKLMQLVEKTKKEIAETEAQIRMNLSSFMKGSGFGYIARAEVQAQMDHLSVRHTELKQLHRLIGLL